MFVLLQTVQDVCDELEYGTVLLNEEMHLYIILGIVNSTADEQCANKSSELYIFRHF